MLELGTLMLCVSSGWCCGFDKQDRQQARNLLSLLSLPVKVTPDSVVGCSVGVAGDHASCLFSLLPVAQVYPASGINANIQVHLHSLGMGRSLQMAAWDLIVPCHQLPMCCIQQCNQLKPAVGCQVVVLWWGGGDCLRSSSCCILSCTHNSCQLLRLAYILPNSTAPRSTLLNVVCATCTWCCCSRSGVALGSVSCPMGLALAAKLVITGYGWIPQWTMA